MVDHSDKPESRPNETRADREPTFDVVRELHRLESMRDPLIEESGRSNRQVRRYPVREEAEVFPMSRHRLNDHGIGVHLRDIGRGGVGFLSDRPIASGQDYRIVFHRDGYAVGSAAINVRYSKPVRSGVHLIGATFAAGAGLLTSLGVQPAELEAEYRGEAFGGTYGTSAA